MDVEVERIRRSSYLSLLVAIQSHHLVHEYRYETEVGKVDKKARLLRMDSRAPCLSFILIAIEPRH